MSEDLTDSPIPSLPSALSPAALSPDPSPTLFLQRTIVLIGLMGAGKSAVGRRLANRLGLSFRDADREIEEAAGYTISEIFALHGEPYFRDGERRVIRRLLDEPLHVLATGGGAFMTDETRALIGERALTVWLKADLEILVERTGRRNNRPLLQTGDPRKILGQLMEERYPVYALADITVETANTSIEQTVDRVLLGLRRYHGQKPDSADRQPVYVGMETDAATGRGARQELGR